MKGNELILLVLVVLHITAHSSKKGAWYPISRTFVQQYMYLLQHEMMKFLMMTDEWPFSDNIAMVFKVHGA